MLRYQTRCASLTSLQALDPKTSTQGQKPIPTVGACALSCTKFGAFVDTLRVGDGVEGYLYSPSQPVSYFCTKSNDSGEMPLSTTDSEMTGRGQWVPVRIAQLRSEGSFLRHVKVKTCY